ncbi:MAG: ferritin family protein [Methanothrix sp.]
MPEFLNPFSGKVPDRLLTKEELIRAVRLDLAAEHEAVHLYMAHAEATDNLLAKSVFIDIANEERVHAGEFARLLAILTGDEDALLAEGAKEVDEMAAELSASAQPTLPSSPSDAPSAGSETPSDSVATTIGSLKIDLSKK